MHNLSFTLKEGLRFPKKYQTSLFGRASCGVRRICPASHLYPDKWSGCWAHFQYTDSTSQSRIGKLIQDTLFVKFNFTTFGDRELVPYTNPRKKKARFDDVTELELKSGEVVAMDELATEIQAPENEDENEVVKVDEKEAQAQVALHTFLQNSETHDESSDSEGDEVKSEEGDE